MISRTMTFWELTKDDGDVLRGTSEAMLSKLQKQLGGVLAKVSEQRVAIEDDDFLNAGSFRVLPGKNADESEAAQGNF